MVHAQSLGYPLERIMSTLAERNEGCLYTGSDSSNLDSDESLETPRGHIPKLC